MAEEMTSAAERFLAEGMFKYAEGYATVMAFEAAIREKVAEVASREATRIPGTKSHVKVTSGVCNAMGKDGRVAYAQFRGELGGEGVKWEIGIWWQQPSAGKEVHLYAECREGPERFTSSRWASVAKGNTEGFEGYVAGISLKLEPGVEVTKGFRALLDEVARQSHALAAKKT
jgi:hypothetical protein